jgi:hypothetical protein
MSAPYQTGAAGEQPNSGEAPASGGPDSLSELKAQIDALQKRIETMSKTDKGK